MGCSLCVLKDLDRMGVKAIKIVGRDRDYKRSAKVVELFQSVLKSKSDDVGLLIPEYWQRIWCQKGRCKYLNSPYLKYLFRGSLYMTREYFMLHMDQDALVNTRLDHIVLGNEGCALQAISPEVVENISFASQLGIKIRYLTPIVPISICNVFIR